MKGLIWLASYPKSGNTWFRIFLANLLSGRREPVDINLLDIHSWKVRRTFDKRAGWDTSLLTREEIRVLGLKVQRIMAKHSAFTILKAHDAFTEPEGNREIFCRDSMGAVIYLVRNPLDIAVSFGHHLALSPDQTIEILKNPKGKLAEMKRRVHIGLPEYLRDWSGHVSSWTEAKGVRIHILRYEDLRHDPLGGFTQACRFLGIKKEQAEIEWAIKNSSFETVQKQELEKGFSESLNREPFFRKGSSGGWRGVLNPEQVRRIIDSHSPMMRRFGYLDDEMRPI